MGLGLNKVYSQKRSGLFLLLTLYSSRFYRCTLRSVCGKKWDIYSGVAVAETAPGVSNSEAQRASTIGSACAVYRSAANMIMNSGVHS